MAWHLLVRGEEVESDLPLDHAVDEPPHDGEPRQGRDPFGLLQPYGTNGRRMLAPTTTGFHGRVVLLIRVKKLRVRTRLRTHGRGQDRPSVVLRRTAQHRALDE